MLYLIDYSDADRKHPEKQPWMDELIGYSFSERAVAYCLRDSYYYQLGKYYYWTDIYGSNANVI